MNAYRMYVCTRYIIHRIEREKRIKSVFSLSGIWAPFSVCILHFIAAASCATRMQMQWLPLFFFFVLFSLSISVFVHSQKYMYIEAKEKTKIYSWMKSVDQRFSYPVYVSCSHCAPNIYSILHTVTWAWQLVVPALRTFDCANTNGRRNEYI